MTNANENGTVRFYSPNPFHYASHIVPERLLNSLIRLTRPEETSLADGLRAIRHAAPSTHKIIIAPESMPSTGTWVVMTPGPNGFNYVLIRFRYVG
jgi:hypothetical protein